MARKTKSSQFRPTGFAEERQASFKAKLASTKSNHQVAELGAGGRLVIPAPFRAALDMKPGDKLTVRLEGNELRIYTRREGIRRVQDMMRKYIPEGVSLADELIAERRAEAAKELEEAEEWLASSSTPRRC